MLALPHHLCPLAASQDLKVFGALWTWPGLDLKKRTIVVVVSDATIARTGPHPVAGCAATGLDEPPGRHKRSRRSGAECGCTRPGRFSFDRIRSEITFLTLRDSERIAFASGSALGSNLPRVFADPSGCQAHFRVFL